MRTPIKKSFRISSKGFVFVLMIVLGIIGSSAIFIGCSQDVRVNVEGNSMYPTMRHGSTLSVNRRNHNPRRGDIVIVQDPRAPFVGNLWVKRLIALGDDQIYFRESRLSMPSGGQWYEFIIEINGQEINEYYLDEHYGLNITFRELWNWTRISAINRGPFGRYIKMSERGRYEIHVPTNYMFYLSDHRRAWNTGDGATEGPQPTSHLWGVVTRIRN
ncbi:MAG: signal peptidase I [Firmicutes bacterium]|nr:signal peptidase I [Bacillota bacterium]